MVAEDCWRNDGSHDEMMASALVIVNRQVVYRFYNKSIEEEEVN